MMTIWNISSEEKRPTRTTWNTSLEAAKMTTIWNTSLEVEKPPMMMTWSIFSEEKNPISPVVILNSAIKIKKKLIILYFD
jgi:hypothetical protein